MSLTKSSFWLTIACSIFVKTWWKCFIYINCRLIVLVNLALYSNKYSKLRNEICLFWMIFFMYSLCSFRCKFIEINLFFNFEMLINEFVNIIFFKFEKMTSMLSIKTCITFSFDNWIYSNHETKWRLWRKQTIENQYRHEI